MALVAFYYLTIWRVPVLTFPEWRWFMVLGLMAFAFLLQGQPLNTRTAKAFLIINLLPVAGGVLSLVRTQYPDIALTHIVGSLLTVAMFFLMVQLLATRQARTVLLGVLWLAATLWLVEILSRTALLSELARRTFYNDADKNYLALLLALSATSLLATGIFADLSPFSTLKRLLLRLALLAGVGLASYAALLLYSRSGLLTLGVGLFGVIALWAAQRGFKGFVLLLVAIGLIVGGFSLLADDFFAAFPYWQTTLERLAPDQITTFNLGRVTTFEKSLALIADNPIIGIGPGTYRNIVVDPYSPERLSLIAHNTYLALWSENGLPGILGMMVWGFMTFRLLKRHFRRMTLADKCWIAMTIPYFCMLFFLDLGTNMVIFTAIFSTIYYQYVDSGADG